MPGPEGATGSAGRTESTSTGAIARSSQAVFSQGLIADPRPRRKRLRRVSTSTRLSAAQLALAREYGFSSWAWLKAEVVRRRAASRQPRTTAARKELRTWSDLGLRLPSAKASGRLQSARGVGNGSMTVKLALTSAEDLDTEAIGWLRRAYEENA